MFRRCPHLLLGLLCLASGCGTAGDSTPPDLGLPLGGPISGGQTGQEIGLALPCADVPFEELTADEVSDAGFSAEDLLASTTGTYRAPWHWADGSEAQASLEIASAEGAHRYVTGDDAECAGVLWVPVTLRFATEDGSFDETWPAQLRASQLDQVSVLLTQPVTALDGALILGQLPLPELEFSESEQLDSYVARFVVVGGEASGAIEVTISSTPHAGDQLSKVRSVRLGELGEFSPSDVSGKPPSIE